MIFSLEDRALLLDIRYEGSIVRHPQTLNGAPPLAQDVRRIADAVTPAIHESVLPGLLQFQWRHRRAVFWRTATRGRAAGFDAKSSLAADTASGLLQQRPVVLRSQCAAKKSVQRRSHPATSVITAASIGLMRRANTVARRVSVSRRSSTPHHQWTATLSRSRCVMVVLGKIGQADTDDPLRAIGD